METRDRIGGFKEESKIEHEDGQGKDDIPDPDEDDLDGLDDMLEEFSAAKIEPPADPPTKPEAAPVSKDGASAADLLRSEDFTKELQDQMAALMGGMEESPGINQEFEKVMKELETSGDKGSSASNDAKMPKGKDDFQETIRKTMERMQSSGDQAGSAAEEEVSEVLLGQMLNEMQSGRRTTEGDDEGFNNMLLSMMQQLTNKDILYDPMKELHDKYPAWMEKNGANTKPEDMKQYKQQQQLVGEMVERFEQKGYSDSKPADREFIVDRMQQMQAAGSPPADLVGGIENSEALNDMESTCAQQ